MIFTEDMGKLARSMREGWHLISAIGTSHADHEDEDIMNTTVTGRLITTEPSIREAEKNERIEVPARLLNVDLAAIELRISKFLCGVTTGHNRNSVRRFEDRRVYLECMDCGHESPGWETGK